MAIENVELIHECSPVHLSMGTVRSNKKENEVRQRNRGRRQAEKSNV